MANVSVSFVVPVYNAEGTIRQCIESILAQGVRKEVIVIDDGSTDSTFRLMRGFGKRIVSIGQAKRGAASARNKGLGIAGGDFVAFIDADVILPKGWTSNALKIIKDKETAGVGGPGLSKEGGVVSRSLDALLFGRSPDKELSVNSLATMNVMYRKSAIKGMRFDESFRGAAGEDPDFNFRLLKKGYRLVFSPLLRVNHKHPTTMGSIMKKWYNYGRHVPMLYSRHRGMRGKSYYGMVLFMPSLFLFSALAVLFPLLLAIPVMEVCALFLFYLRRGAGIEKRPNIFAFSLVHTFKQLAQLLGVMVGLFRKP
jgi:glycosyltransferase involved in cell wall biosynthesis